MSKTPTSPASGGKGSYEIGYGKPPKSGQFKKGQSGNPKGRRKGSRNMKSIARDLMDTKVPVRKDGETKMVSVFEALLLKGLAAASSGNLRDIERFLKMAQQYDPEALAPPQDAPTKVVWEFVESDGNGGPMYSREQWLEQMEKEKKAKAEDDDDPLDR